MPLSIDYLISHQSALPHAREIETLRRLASQKRFGPTYNNTETQDQILRLQANTIKLDQPCVDFSSDKMLSPDDQTKLLEMLQRYIPWKKGPFRIFGIDIDSEWRSDLKWQRILDLCPIDLSGKTIADIGCNNGYFMFRMAAQNPELVVGIEPVIKHWQCFDFLQRIAHVSRVFFEPLGAENMNLYPNFFDVIFCMGILYHHTDPVGILRKLRSALKPGGKLVVEIQGIDHPDSIALVPSGKYAGASGVWFIASESCCEHWIRRAGFSKVECFYKNKLSTEEQRKTSWAPISSLAEYLDPNDSTKTIEGYPAPVRIYFSASR